MNSTSAVDISTQAVLPESNANSTVAPRSGDGMGDRFRDGCFRVVSGNGHLCEQFSSSSRALASSAP